MIKGLFLNLAVILGLCFVSFAAWSAIPVATDFYKYAHNEDEYSVMLPEAPTVTTIWADEKKVPYLEDPPEEGAVGEEATFRRIDAKTEDSFDVKITFLKASYDFLDGLTEDKMREALEKDYKESEARLDGVKFEVKQGHVVETRGEKIQLKWVALTGFSTDENGRPIFNVAHYLTGQQSILVIKVRYSLENKVFEDFYNKLVSNITYYTP